MPSGYYPKSLVYPKLIVSGPNGYFQVIDFSEWSSGYYSWVKSEKVSRKRPVDLLSPGALTGHFGGQTQEQYIAPLSWNFSAGPYLYQYQDQDSSYYLAAGGVPPPDTPDWQTKLLLAVKDQKVNAVVAMAEAGKTMDMFSGNATTIYNVLRDLRKGDVPGAMRHLGLKPKKLRGTIANRWLELRYGWMPLLSDLHGAVEELQRNLDVPRYRKLTVRAKAESRLHGTANGPMPGMKIYVDGNHSISCKATIYLRQASPVMTRVGATNPAVVAWELLPYSFVIDWLIPIGNWLNSLDAAIGVESAYGTLSTKTKITSVASTGSFYRLTSHSRGMLPSLPGPVLPRYTPSINSIRVLNALGLLSQMKR
jgi:hypothetical protein